MTIAEIAWALTSDQRDVIFEMDQGNAPLAG
jgi:hypothetical protein